MNTSMWERLRNTAKLSLALLLIAGVWSGGEVKQAAADEDWLSNIEVEAGNNYSIAYMDYSYLAFGQNTQSQLGIGNEFFTPEPTMLTQDGIKSVEAGGNHTLFVTNYGTVESFGANEYGQSDPDSFRKMIYKPTEIPYLTGVIAAAAGEKFSAALKYDGTVWVWGYNPHDDNLLRPTDRPIQVKGALEGVKVKSIAAGYNTAYAIAENGDLYEWGESLVGPIPDSEDPHIIEHNVEKVSASRYHALLIKEGRVYAWGSNDFGMLGLGSLDNRIRPIPTKVPFLSNYPVKDVSAGLFHSMALGEEGKVYTWGANGFGQVGKPKALGEQRDEIVENPYRLDITSVVSISAGNRHSLAITRDRTVYAWGYNQDKQVSSAGEIIYDKPYIVYNARPSAPTGITVSKADLTGRVTIKWQRKEEDIDHYMLYWKKESDIFMKSVSVPSETYIFLVKGLVEGRYEFMLKAVDEYGEQSLFSDKVYYVHSNPKPIYKEVKGRLPNQLLE